jgi:hypothetical protein
MGYQTVLVLSGGTSREDLPRFAYRPDLIVESVATLIEKLADESWLMEFDSAQKAEAFEGEASLNLGAVRRRAAPGF